MSSEPSPTSLAAVDAIEAGKRAYRQRVAVGGVAAVSVALSVVGVVIGIRMATRRIVVDCGNGHYFPQGTTNFDCYSHPHAGQGAAAAIGAALLGVIVALLAFIAFTLLTITTRADGAELLPTQRPSAD